MTSATFFLDTQISSLQRSIISTNQQLAQKQEELLRLKKALSQLLDCEEAFSDRKSVFLNPQLSRVTWHGNMAKYFDSMKQGELQGSYQSLSYEDLNHIIS